MENKNFTIIYRMKHLDQYTKILHNFIYNYSLKNYYMKNIQGRDGE